jgi:hypothetical protein
MFIIPVKNGLCDCLPRNTRDLATPLGWTPPCQLQKKEGPSHSVYFGFVVGWSWRGVPRQDNKFLQDVVSSLRTNTRLKQETGKIYAKKKTNFRRHLAGDAVMTSETAQLVSLFVVLILSFTFMKRWPAYVAGELVSIKICFLQYSKHFLLWIELEKTENYDNREWR